MQDLYSLLRQLQRPRPLVQAARFGLDEYRRDRHLRRVIGSEILSGHASALIQLLEIERAHETARKEGSASYSVARHVESLVAIMGETHLLRATTRPELASVVTKQPPQPNSMSNQM